MYEALLFIAGMVIVTPFAFLWGTRCERERLKGKVLVKENILKFGVRKTGQNGGPKAA